MNVLSAGKPAIVVPRLSKYGEHTNDHQMEITEALEKEGKIIAVYDMGKMDKAIIKAEKFIAKKESGCIKISSLIQDQINMWF